MKTWNRPWLAALAALALTLTACTVLRTAGPTVLTSAACLVMQRQPAAEPFIGLVGDCFTAMSRTNVPPTPAEIQEALAHLPAGTLTVAARQAVWSGALLAYSAAYAAAQTPEAKAALSETLSACGSSLTAAVELCGRAAPASKTATRALAKPLTADDLRDLADAVQREFERRR